MRVILTNQRRRRLFATGASLTLLLLLLAVQWPQVAVAQQGGLTCTPDFEPATPGFSFIRREHAELSTDDQARIGQIYYSRLPIFDESDPEEDNFLFRWANDFHMLTREETISWQLLFAEGTPYDPRLLAESGRLLRSQSFFSDAAIRPISRCGDEVAVEVITKDNWSLTPTIAFDRFGGENTFALGVRDSNLLGRGKLLSMRYGEDLDQRTSDLQYKDNNVFGTRIRNSTTIVDSDEGEVLAFDTDLPFFSLDSRHSWAVRLKNEQRRDEQYFRGEEVSEVIHQLKDYALEMGFSKGLRGKIANRWRVGLRYERNDFLPSPDLPPPALFPADRKLVYPYVSYESVEDDFATAVNFEQINRTEDLQLGHQWSLTLGYAASALGSDANRWIVRGQYRDTLNYDADSLWQHSMSLEGLLNSDSGHSEDVLLTYENRYYRRQTDRRSFFARIEAEYAHKLSSHRQVVLGGYTGARGFENQFQAGDRRVLLTLEERLYTDIHLFNLVRVGGAVFMDAGRAWEPGVDDGLRQDWLANIGFGLRLSSSKAASDRIAHLDFAFPLTNQNDPSVDKVLLAFTVKGTF